MSSSQVSDPYHDNTSSVDTPMEDNQDVTEAYSCIHETKPHYSSTDEIVFDETYLTSQETETNIAKLRELQSWKVNDVYEEVECRM